MGTDDVISVAELSRRLRRAVEGVTGAEWIEGEIGSLKLAPSGHAYFVLKDEAEDAIVDCVMYRSSLQRSRRHLSEGARVQLLGRASIYAPRGRLQLIADRARPAGRGALLEALERLKEKLAAEGLFAPEKRRALPAEPRIVGVVTSASGAAFHDIRTVAFRRGGARLVLSPAPVQGEGAAEAIVAAIDKLERYPGIDVMIVGRGGGAFEDLMAFNDERVVRRIAAARVPVVSAVGHEVDVTLADHAADVRAATPSQAAELVIPDARAHLTALLTLERQLARAMRGRLRDERGAVERLRSRLSDPRYLIAYRQQNLDDLTYRLAREQSRRIARQRARLSELERRLAGRHPRAVLSDARARLSPLSARLASAVRLMLERRSSELSSACAGLDALSPLSVLGRGYAIVVAPGGRAVRDAGEVRPGNALNVRLHRGTLDVSVVAAHAAKEEPA